MTDDRRFYGGGFRRGRYWRNADDRRSERGRLFDDSDKEAWRLPGLPEPPSLSELKFQRELNYTRLQSADYSTHPLSVGQTSQHARPGIQVGVIERIEEFGTEL